MLCELIFLLVFVLLTLPNDNCFNSSFSSLNLFNSLIISLFCYNNISIFVSLIFFIFLLQYNLRCRVKLVLIVKVLQ